MYCCIMIALTEQMFNFKSLSRTKISALPRGNNHINSTTIFQLAVLDGMFIIVQELSIENQLYNCDFGTL